MRIIILYQTFFVKNNAFYTKNTVILAISGQFLPCCNKGDFHLLFFSTKDQITEQCSTLQPALRAKNSEKIPKTEFFCFKTPQKASFEQIPSCIHISKGWNHQLKILTL